jgi:hypothetical protein
MCPIIFDKHGVRTGEVFKFNNQSEQFIATDVLTHRWNPDTKALEVLSEPTVVIRSVRNINHPSPVPRERIQVELSYFIGAATYLQLSERK